MVLPQFDEPCFIDSSGRPAPFSRLESYVKFDLCFSWYLKIKNVRFFKIILKLNYLLSLIFKNKGSLQFEDKWDFMRPIVLKLLRQESVTKQQWFDLFS